MEDFKDLDSLFKDTLGNAKVNPPAGVWEGIASSIPAATAAAQTSIWLVAVKWVAGIVLAGGIAVVAYTSLNKENTQAENKDKATQQQNAPAETNVNTNTTGINQDSDKADVNGPLSHRSGQNERATANEENPIQLEINNPHQPLEVEDPNMGNSAPPLADLRPKKQAVKPGNASNNEVANCVHSIEISVQKISNTAYSFTAMRQNGLVDWNFGDGNLENGAITSHEYSPTPGVYLVKAFSRSPLGCRDSAVVKITISGPKPELKNVFTPNGDGLNDVYYVEAKNLIYYNLIISDFQNRQVFVSNNQTIAWDGTYTNIPCPEGWYQVTLAYKYPGDSNTQIVKEKLLLTRDKKD
ncbi:MAG: gliding motility-associated C-terminal domain-containing protein [Bacteroidetes bacterium]|nr:gliding motility-associated C-terminal domain-containing protein [Bacteroidota bacterium]